MRLPLILKEARFFVMDTRKVKKLSLLSFLFLFVIYFTIGYILGDSFSAIISRNILDIILAATELALGIWITLAVVEHSLKEDQSRQWKKVRKSTFSEIMHYINYITMSVPFFMLLELNDKDRRKSDEIRETIQNRMRNYENEGKIAVDAIMELQELLRGAYENIGGNTSRERDESIIRHLKLAYEDVRPMFDIIRTVLLPRVLAHSENDNLRQALINFEIASLKCDNLMRSLSSPLYPIKPGLQILASLIELLEPAACICWLIIDDLEKDP